MKVFKHLQLISIKNPIFNVLENSIIGNSMIGKFNNWKKIDCLQISKFLRFKMIRSSSFEKIFKFLTRRQLHTFLFGGFGVEFGPVIQAPFALEPLKVPNSSAAVTKNWNKCFLKINNRMLLVTKNSVWTHFLVNKNWKNISKNSQSIPINRYTTV